MHQQVNQIYINSVLLAFLYPLSLSTPVSNSIIAFPSSPNQKTVFTADLPKQYSSHSKAILFAPYQPGDSAWKIQQWTSIGWSLRQVCTDLGGAPSCIGYRWSDNRISSLGERRRGRQGSWLLSLLLSELKPQSLISVGMDYWWNYSSTHKERKIEKREGGWWAKCEVWDDIFGFCSWRKIPLWPFSWFPRAKMTLE